MLKILIAIIYLIVTVAALVIDVINLINGNTNGAFMYGFISAIGALTYLAILADPPPIKDPRDREFRNE